ncbi:MAG TPA: BTAD domain-containing putative transcriptional regulator, partial [Longimicrobiaceae bacterium]|nr:BTAD domain-containing putative transcriptional regulator [Longimicrobiaceae bacterium]
MEVHILGPTEVVDGGAPVPLPTGRARSLLGLLTLKAGEVVSVDRLIDELWGESPPPTVETALQGLVSNLRKRLEPHRGRGEPPAILLTRPPGYLLDLGSEQVDSNRFRRMVAQAAEAPPERAAQLLRRALALWRGPALADFVYEPFAQAEIAELEELRLATVEKRIEADLGVGRHREVVGELEALVAEHPLREGLRGLLMLALYRSGRQTEALRVYAEYRSTLIDEMGLDPGPSLQHLEGSILRQDPSLDLETASLSHPAVADERWIPDERRIVTVLAVDVTAATSTGGALDTEISRRLLETCFRRAEAVLAGHGASVTRTMGDTLVGVFGLPAAHEDDALRAVRAAIDLRHLLKAANSELGETGVRLSARTGIETGEVVVTTAAGDLSGGPVRGAAQLQQTAGESEILIGAVTRSLVGRTVLSEPRSVAGGDGLRRTAWRVLDLMPGVAPFPPAAERAMLGREEELSELLAAHAAVTDEGRPLRFLVLGEPGIGKSRLARELASKLGAEARVLTGHCPAYGEGSAFWPLRDIVQAAAGRGETGALLELLRDDDDAGGIARSWMTVMGPAEAGRPAAALFPMMCGFFEALGRHGPVVVILEDLHWAQPTLFDLIEYLTRSVQAPLLLLCLARPELAEEHPDWLEGDRSRSLALGPLSPEESRRLAATRLTGRMVPAEVVMRLLDTAQGNPLFVEQLVATIGEEGDFKIPATVQALLAARIDRLGPAERDLIRSASVLGHRFPAAALTSLLPELARRHAPKHLRTLQRKQLMLGRADSDREELSFRHVLIQQAAYRSMTMQTRAELHERAADWLEAEAGREFEESVGYHLERAYRYRHELGVLDDRTQGIAVRAGENLGLAGLRAFGRFDAAGAENLLSRARELLPGEHPARWEVSFRLAEACETMGRHREAEDALSDLLAAEVSSSERRVVLELERARVRFATGPDPMTHDEIAELASAALTHHEAAGDEA